MAEDISKKTIMVLVLLTIIVSALGTLTVLDSVKNVHISPASQPAQISESTTQTAGVVSLKINKPVQTTGNVILNIVNK